MTLKPSASDVRGVFAMWKREDRELEKKLDSLREWMFAVRDDVVLPFSEAATCLSQLRVDLIAHFDSENELSDQLCGKNQEGSPELEAIRRQAERDHQKLLGQLDELTMQLNALVPPFDSWQAVIDQVERFIDSLEQHEKQESESIAMVMPCKD